MNTEDIVALAKSQNKDTNLRGLAEAYRLIPQEYLPAYTDFAFTFNYCYSKSSIVDLGLCYIILFGEDTTRPQVWGMPVAKSGSLVDSADVAIDLILNDVRLLNCSEDSFAVLKMSKKFNTSIAKRSETIKWVQYYCNSEDFETLSGKDFKIYRQVSNPDSVYSTLERKYYTKGSDIPDSVQDDIRGMMKEWHSENKERLKKLYYLVDQGNALPYNVKTLPDYFDWVLITLYEGDTLRAYSITEMVHPTQAYTVEGKKSNASVEKYPDINRYIHTLEIGFWRTHARENITIELGRGNQVFDKNVYVKEVKQIGLLNKDNPIFKESLNQAKLKLRPKYANLSVRFNTKRVSKADKEIKDKAGTGRKKLW